MLAPCPPGCPGSTQRPPRRGTNKNKKISKWIRTKIQNNKTVQKEIMNKIQPNRNDIGDNVNMHYEYAIFCLCHWRHFCLVVVSCSWFLFESFYFLYLDPDPFVNLFNLECLVPRHNLTVTFSSLRTHAASAPPLSGSRHLDASWVQSLSQK